MLQLQDQSAVDHDQEGSNSNDDQVDGEDDDDDDDEEGEAFDEQGEDEQDEDMMSKGSKECSPLLVLMEQTDNGRPPITTSISQIEPQQVRFASQEDQLYEGDQAAKASGHKSESKDMGEDCESDLLKDSQIDQN